MWHEKPKQIKIYYIQETIDGKSKHYIHPKDEYLYAHIRQLSFYERSNQNALLDGADIEFIINRRKVKPDMYIEFLDDTYKISAIDNYDFNSDEVRLLAKEVESINFDKVLGDDW